MTRDDHPPVIVTRALPDPWIARLRPHCAIVSGPADTSGFCEATWNALPHAQGILSLLTETIDTAVLDRAPHLRVVSNMAVGVDNIDLDACHSRGIAVGNTPGVLTAATAELTFALILAAARNVWTAATDAKAGRWTTWSPTGWLGTNLAGKTLGIVGLGQIGRAVARRANAFEMSVLYTRRTPPSQPELFAPWRHVDLPTLLRDSDVVSIHAPLTTTTRDLIDKDAFTSMQSHAILVNTARGPIVEPCALADALTQGVIAGAAIDVTCPEPLPADHPLYRVPNLLITPHIGSATHQTRRQMAELACDNLLAGLEGRPLPHAVVTR